MIPTEPVSPASSDLLGQAIPESDQEAVEGVVARASPAIPRHPIDGVRQAHAGPFRGTEQPADRMVRTCEKSL